MFFLWISACYCCNCCELYDVWWRGGSGFWWCICMAGSDVSTIGGCGGCCCGGSCRGSGWVACWSLFVKSSILKSLMCNRCSSLLIFTFRICKQEKRDKIWRCAIQTSHPPLLYIWLIYSTLGIKLNPTCIVSCDASRACSFSSSNNLVFGEPEDEPFTSWYDWERGTFLQPSKKRTLRHNKLLRLIPSIWEKNIILVHNHSTQYSKHYFKAMGNKIRIHDFLFPLSQGRGLGWDRINSATSFDTVAFPLVWLFHLLNQLNAGNLGWVVWSRVSAKLD